MSKFTNHALVGIALTIVMAAVVAAAIQEQAPVSKDNKQKITAAEQQKRVPRSKPKRADDTRLYMRAKLASSQRVMEGLVSEKFDLIIDGAEQMKEISLASHWPTAIDEVYQHYSVEFRRQCDKLKEQAEQHDLQAAHYTYLHLSTTCIDCHNYVRPRFEVKRSKKGGPVQLIPTQWEPKNLRGEKPGPDEDVKDKTG